MSSVYNLIAAVLFLGFIVCMVIIILIKVINFFSNCSRSSSYPDTAANIIANISEISSFDDHGLRQNQTDMSRENNENNSSALIIESLRFAQQNASPSDETSEVTNQCAICLGTWNEEEEKQKWVLPCKHMFHSECICEWVKSSGITCPICRSVVIDMES
ncbi:hypothetical protein FRX31_034698 [Thalictrum thalictroides]|uniref:RING-type E3 ubiquitin transferase n=1 Tax=Thalictrum thalictroides TaxID=46969 RepID=A0A7J6UT44_THATH|nr:hypothetical protein FRX31_034698 [Thalictrum thalictroides]